MKRMGVLALAFAVSMSLGLTGPVQAAEKVASPKAFEHASDEAIFHRIGDWFATIGKSEGEKEQILMERKAKRAAKRMEKGAKKAGKEAKKKGEGFMDKVKKSKKPWE